MNEFPNKDVRADVGRPLLTFEWEISMTNNAARRAARDYQAANPGTSYTRALRQASRGDAVAPLTATLGLGLDGRRVLLNLEWESRGGMGPHCLISGLSAAGSSALLATVMEKLYAGQRTGDVDLVFTGPPAPDVEVPHRYVTVDEFPEFIADVLSARVALFAGVGSGVDIEDARAAGIRVPTIVVFIDAPTKAVRSALQSPLRRGRAYGVNFVLATDIASTPTVQLDTSREELLFRLIDRASRGGDIEGMFTSVIFNLDDGRVILRSPTTRDDPRSLLAPRDEIVLFNLPTL